MPTTMSITTTLQLLFLLLLTSISISTAQYLDNCQSAPPIPVEYLPRNTPSPPIPPLDYLPRNSPLPPMVTQFPPLVTQSPPTYISPPPIITQSPSVPVQNLPINTPIPPAVTTQSPPVLNQPPPVFTESPPVLNQPPSVFTQFPPDVAQSPPTTAQSPPTNILAPPFPIQSPPVTVQSSPITTQSPPVTTEVPPFIMQSPPVIIQSPPVNMQSPPGTPQSPSVNMQSPPGTPKSPLGSPQSPPLTMQSPPLITMQSPPNTTQSSLTNTQPPQNITLSQSPQPPKRSIFSAILYTLGYPSLSTAATQANLTTTTPTTIFAPSDSSLLTCPSCSLPLLLQEHSLPGLYSLHYLRFLSFGTKIATLAPNRCLTITITTTTTSTENKKIFINGVEISKPDIYNDGFLIIHGIQGFVSHLSPLSCNIESMTTLDYSYQPTPTTTFHDTRMLLKEAIMKLRASGYSVVALAMQVRYSELSELKGLTVFALDDESIFAGGIGHRYVRDIGYHVMPNRVMGGSELVGLSPFSVLDTAQRGQILVVTTAGGGGPLMPMRINYVKIKSFDLVHNDRIVVHGLSMPFPHVEDPRKM